MENKSKIIKSILDKSLSGKRITQEEGVILFKDGDLLELGFVANHLRRQKHPDDSPVTFVIDRNVNYTNVCSCECTFCEFHKTVSSNQGYVLSYEIIKNKVQELIDINGTQLLLQGGLNPGIDLNYYLNLIEKLSIDFPALTIHAFSPPEIVFISENNNISIKNLLVLLKEKGLSSIPGGGAEILVDKIRNLISPNKISSAQWLNVMETAHQIGLKTTATMMAGTVEQPEDIIEHLLKIRTLQDKTSGFTAFIPWSYQGNNENYNKQAFTGQDYLKLIAISRIFLDNINNIQASWPTQGIKIAQIALNFGANDFGGTMMEENVITSTGHEVKTSIGKITQAIKGLNRTPAQRKTDYQILKIFDTN